MLEPVVFTPSPQQEGIFSWVDRGRGSAFVEAVAGSGKTTTLIEALKRTHGYVAFAAYNKKIADEIKARTAVLGLGNRLRVGTFHSFGLSAWRSAHRDVQSGPEAAREKSDLMFEALSLAENGVDEVDVHDIAQLRSYVAEFPRSFSTLSEEEKQLRTFTSKLVSHAKQTGVFLFWQPGDQGRWFDIIDHHDLAYELEDDRLIDRGIADAIWCIGWAREVGGQLIDFDDMIWLPVISNVRFWGNDWVLVDEAQDTNPVRRALARKMLRPGGRAIFVGDRHQAIYGFTGADNDAVDLIMRDFNCAPLPLTVTYRCPKSVVAEAQRYVSHITAAPSAPEGIVRAVPDRPTFMKDELPTLRPTDAILCRTTKPLVALAFSLIKRGVGCHVEGRDIGQGLVKLATRWKVKRADSLRLKLDDFRSREVQRLTAKGRESEAEAVNDRVDTLLLIMEGCTTVEEVVLKITRLFQDTEDGVPARTLTLATVHRSKGREWDRVYILGFREFMPSRWARQRWQQDQENNLIYVAITRTKQELVYLPDLGEEAA